MQRFLDKVVDHYIQSKINLSSHTFILPNIRAGVFLKTSFKNNLKGVSFIPRIISIEAFITQLSGLSKIDNLYLLFEFYKIYLKNNTPERTEPFESFARWAFLLLQDFNDIDKNLKNTGDIFDYLIDTKRIEKIFLNEEQSEITQNYFNFIEKIGLYYNELSVALKEKEIGYQGLQYRQAYENIPEFIKKNKQEKFVLIGFNALNNAEEKIFQELLENDLAKIFWDTDTFYLKPQNLTGRFIYKYKTEWKYYQNHNFLWVDNRLSKAKNINITGAAKNVNQIKYIGNILKLSEDKNNNYRNTAIILGDEKLLPVLLNSLPEEVNQVNITMGYSLKNIAFSSVFELLFKMHINKNRADQKDYFYFKDVADFLSLSVFNSILDQDLLKKDLAEYIKSNIVLIHKNKIHVILQTAAGVNTVLSELFEEWDTDIESILKTIVKLINQLKDNDQLKSLEIEYLFRFKTIFSELETLNGRYRYIDNLNALYQFYQQILNNESLSFRGEPLEGLQIMGMLESRVLDFENVIITSVNEGILPEGKKQNSFIPYDIKLKFGLTTYQDKDAIFSYHFFRILQRAKNIVLTYNTQADEYGLGEQSRFITQLELAGESGELPDMIIKRDQVNPIVSDKKLELLNIEKNESVLKILHTIAKKGFSPSALTSYIRNPVDFYKKRILHIDDLETIEENVAFNTFGTIIHKALENLYTPYIKKILTGESIKNIRSKVRNEVRSQFLEHFSTTGISKGKNFLSLEVAVKYILKFLDKESEMIESGKKIRIIDLERNIIMQYQPETLNIPVTLKGVVDRIDEVDGVLRIIDYKTGKVESKHLKINDWNELITDHNYSKSFQILMYAYLYSNELHINPDKSIIEGGIISFKNMKSGFMRLNSSRIQNTEIDNFRKQLDLLLKEIFDLQIPFTEKELKAYKY